MCVLAVFKALSLDRVQLLGVTVEVNVLLVEVFKILCQG